MRTTQEITEEILRRIDIVEAEKNRFWRRVKAVLSVLTMCVGIVVVAVVAGQQGVKDAPPAQATVMLLGGAGIGFFVLFGVLVFSAGIAATLLIQWVRRRKRITPPRGAHKGMGDLS